MNELTCPVGLEQGPIIYIGCSRADLLVARDVTVRLQRCGFRPFLLGEKKIDEDQRGEVKSAISTANVVLICLSKFAFTQFGEVDEHIKIVLGNLQEQHNGRRVLVARLDECKLPKCLSKSDCFNLYMSSGFADLMKALFGAISRELSTSPPGYF